MSHELMISVIADYEGLVHLRSGSQTAVVGKDGALKLVAAWLATGKMSDVIPRSPARAINGGNG